MNTTATVLLGEAPLGALLSELRAQGRSNRFEVAPNPTVGAAVLAGSRVVGRGFHAFWGGPHAEVAAIEAARASGVDPDTWDTLVVTLEPCSSHGKTPPCTDLILSTGIRRVVVGAVDPDPRHAGSGLEQLRSAGVEVELLDPRGPRGRHASEPPLDRHFEDWVRPERLRRPRPWTIAKWAQTRTGQLSPPEDVGAGRWISSAGSQEEVHRLRGRVDAIVTGVGTVLADDPRLSVRLPAELRATAPLTPHRIVLDGYLRTPPEARLLADSGTSSDEEAAGPVTLLCRAGLTGSAAARRRALEEQGVRMVSMPTDETGHLSLREVQGWLHAEGHRRVLLEAGPTLLAGYLERGFIDQLRVYTGDVNGGRGPSMAEWFTRLRLAERLDREVAEDAVLEAFLRD